MEKLEHRRKGGLTMSRFIAFDVETPNRLNHRMSAIGITVIDNGAIMEDFYSLVDPQTHFDYFNSKLTGINEDVVRDAPTMGKNRAIDVKRYFGGTQCGI